MTRSCVVAQAAIQRAVQARALRGRAAASENPVGSSATPTEHGDRAVLSFSGAFGPRRQAATSSGEPRCGAAAVGAEGLGVVTVDVSSSRAATAPAPMRPDVYSIEACPPIVGARNGAPCVDPGPSTWITTLASRTSYPM